MSNTVIDAPVVVSPAANTPNVWHPYWSLSVFEDPQAALRSPSFGLNAKVKAVRYPLRAMRYWFMDHLIRREVARQGRPLRVLEVGVDTGQMLAFMNGADPSHDAVAPLPEGIDRWDAVTLKPDRPRLERLGYSEVLEQDIERPEYEPPVEAYDVVILLHVMEHLKDPEAALCNVAQGVRPGGILIGGYPSVPDVFRRFREWQLRHGASRHGHLSKFSPARTRAMARRAGLQAEWLSGAFMHRRKGSWLENSRSWTRFNLAFGAVFPGWPGENYWQLRK